MTQRSLSWAAVIFLAACAAGGRGPRAMDGAGAPAHFAGTFEGELRLGDYHNVMLVTVHEDGTMTSSDGNDFEGAGHGRFNSPGYGSWRPTGARTTVFAVREFEYDSTGAILGTSTIRGTGNYSADGRDVTGTMGITTWRGQAGPQGLTYQMHRIEPATP